MIIQCPYCATRFQLDDSRLAGPHPMLKCSRCRHIFPGPAQPGASAAAKPSATPPSPTMATGRKGKAGGATGAPENLSFTFSDPPARDSQEDFTIDEPEQEFELGTEAAEPPDAPLPSRQAEPEEAPGAADELEQEEQPGLFVEEPEPTPAAPATLEPRPRRSEPERFVQSPDKDEFDAEDFDADELEEDRVIPGGVSVRPVLIFLTLVVLAYGALSWTLRSDPELAESLLHKLPFISSLTEDRLLNRKIVLNEVTGGYQRIKDGGTVFVITGRALNNAPITVHNVQIVGRLFDGDSRQVEEKSIFCGNVISTKILRSLTQREVSILQDLKPPKRFGIAPGDEASFVIVFMQPPNGVTEFSSQVTAAQRQT